MSAAVWLIVALILLGAEALGGELVLLMLAGGAFAAAATAAATDSPVLVEGIVFAVVSVVLLITVRPVARRQLSKRPALATNAQALPGKTATVIELVSGQGGQVRLAGEVWSARSLHPGDEFAPGQDVQVMEIDGATAVVWRN
ncbi:NfeD family protein [Williamsia sp. CHRR-6]|uniref:NfeD family protein n=1 Tax=Williamsia sp. CHRR-6 TaxID=2835871 RepID=UPI001BD94868|nr:NfeD family protein [Williamsia sp. CHRR-6]MBT0568073.1 NfeD family protein [Williamsia sp. CHRR-6]